MMTLYPLKFTPLLVEKIWGGRKIGDLLGKALPEGKLIGESWELYDFPPGVVEGSSGWVSAAVASGPLAGMTLHELVQSCGRELMGDVPLVGEAGQFPVLIKYLDAREDLSVQVHPDAAYCQRHPDAHLKSEAWYVVQHEPGARLLKGMMPGATREQFEQAIATGEVEQLIKSIPARQGDCHYLESGTVHALGAGMLAAEVQTPSDTTFRVYDFGRLDPGTGKPRRLHVEQAMECIGFSGRAEKPQQRSHSASYHTTVSRLCSCPYFTIEKVRMVEGLEEAVPYDQPVVWMMLQGECEVRVEGLVEPTRLGRGDTVLLPAKMNKPMLKTLSDCVWLEATMPTRR
jgi:mannose-6-phosphate isomerase